MLYQKHLKEKSNYEEQYDRQTVEIGLKHEKMLMDINPPEEMDKDESGTAKIRLFNVFMWNFKGERYSHRSETMNQWMVADQKRDSICENATKPELVLCKFCQEPMRFGHEWLDFDYDSNTGVMEFLYYCNECHVGKKIVNNKTIEDIIPWKCPKCSQRMQTNSKKVRKKIVHADNCGFCGYEKISEFDLNIKIESVLIPSPEEEKQYRIDKDRFCLSEKEGQEYILGRDNIKRLNEMMKEIKPAVKMSAKVLNLENVKKFLIKELKNHGFINFKMGKVEMKQGMAVDFSVHDEKNRHSNQARLDLNKSIKEILQDTNWHLMSKGTSGYLGILKGRLRGVEANSYMYGYNGDIIKF